MRVFKNKAFSRFARKAGISDDALKALSAEMEAGVWEACYGGDVYKKRVARAGEGKSGGYRAIIIFRKEKITYFVYGYPKTEKEDLDEKEQRDYKERATDVLSSSDVQIQARLDAGDWIEIF